MPTWLCSPDYLALGGWTHHRNHLIHLDLFYIVLPCILTITTWSLQHLLFMSFIVPIFEQKFLFISPIYLKRSLVFPFLLFSSSFIGCLLRYYFANKGPSSQGYGFSSGHIWMWDLDCEESWAPKNWCFWTVVLEKTLESPLDCKEIHPVHSEGDQSWMFIGRTDAEAETPILWPPDAKSWFIGKDPDAGRDWGQEEKGTTEDEMAGWHHRLDGREFEWTLGVCDGQGGSLL